MANKMFFSILLLIACVLGVKAAKVDTVSVYSEAMKKDIKVVVIEPEVSKEKETPVLYLLHGYSGKYSDWVLKAPHITELADQFGITIVCPDGGFGSWYWDIENDANYQYETFVSNELVSYIDKNYSVIADRAYRGISGLSMGGHGALYLALRNQDVYSVVGSTAGGVDFRPFPDNWQIKDRLGEYAQNKDAWEDHTVINLLHLYKPNSLEIWVDCGKQDFFYGVNEALHQKMDYLNIPHRYLVMPGAHKWDYWKRSIAYQMAYFGEVFDGRTTK